MNAQVGTAPDELALARVEREVAGCALRDRRDLAQSNCGVLKAES